MIFDCFLKSVWIAFVFGVLSFLFFYSVMISSPQGRFGQTNKKKINSGWKLRLLLQHKDNGLVCVASRLAVPLCLALEFFPFEVKSVRVERFIVHSAQRDLKLCIETVLLSSFPLFAVFHSGHMTLPPVSIIIINAFRIPLGHM